METRGEHSVLEKVSSHSNPGKLPPLRSRPSSCFEPSSTEMVGGDVLSNSNGAGQPAANTISASSTTNVFFDAYTNNNTAGSTLPLDSPDVSPTNAGSTIENSPSKRQRTIHGQGATTAPLTPESPETVIAARNVPASAGPNESVSTSRKTVAPKVSHALMRAKESAALSGRTASAKVACGGTSQPGSPRAIPGAPLVIKQKPFWKRKPTARENLTYAFFALQAIMLGVGLKTAKGLEAAVLSAELNTATAVLAGTELLYTAKTTQMGLGYAGASGEALIKNYASNPDPAAKAAVTFRLAGEITNRQIEFSTLLDTQKRILISSNAVRTGEYFDPQGVVTGLQTALAATGNTTQIKMSTTISYANLTKELPPQWLGRSDAGSPAQVHKHPYITKGSGLIRYTATAVRNGTVVIGYLVSGDLIDGKLSVAGDLFLSLWASSSLAVSDGFVGIYTPDANLTTIDEGYGWRGCSHAAMATIVDLQARAMSVNTDPSKRSLLTDAAATPTSAQVVMSANKSTGYIFTAKRAANLAPAAANVSESVVVLVQGTHSPQWKAAAWLTVRTLLIIFAIDIVAIMAAVYVFLLPLERMGKRVREGKELSLNSLDGLKKRRHWLLPILCVPVLSFAVSVYNSYWALTYLDDSIVKSGIKMTSMVGIQYDVKLEQMRLGFTGLSINPTVTALATTLFNSTDPSTVSMSTLTPMLAAQIPLRKIEFSAFFGADRRLRANPTTSAYIGQQWDTPSGSLQLVLDTGESRITSEIIPYAEYQTFNSTKWIKKASTASPTSALHPDVTHADVLVRFACIPVKTTDAYGTVIKLGVLVAADIVNGMTEIPENANTLVNREGYAAIYIKVNSTAPFQLVSSALRNSTMTSAVDVGLPSDKIDEFLGQVYNDPQIIVSEKLEINGDTHILTARCAAEPYSMKSEGRLFDDYAEGGKCLRIFVQSSNDKLNAETWTTTLIFQLVLLGTQFLKLLFLFRLLWLAFRPFRQIVLNGGMKKRAKRPVKSNRGASSNNTSNVSSYQGSTFLSARGKSRHTQKGSLMTSPPQSPKSSMKARTTTFKVK